MGELSFDIAYTDSNKHHICTLVLFISTILTFCFKFSTSGIWSPDISIWFHLPFQHSGNSEQSCTAHIVGISQSSWSETEGKTIKWFRHKRNIYVCDSKESKCTYTVSEEQEYPDAKLRHSKVCTKQEVWCAKPLITDSQHHLTRNHNCIKRSPIMFTETNYCVQFTFCKFKFHNHLIEMHFSTVVDWPVALREMTMLLVPSSSSPSSVPARTPVRHQRQTSWISLRR